MPTQSPRSLMAGTPPVGAPPLSADRISSLRTLAFVEWELVPTASSTNSDLLERARECALQGPVARVADQQTAGRGRLGRAWQGSTGGSIYLSIAVPWGRDAASSPAVTLACGVAVVQVLKREGIELALKWPNDVLLEGRKLAGILTEFAEDAQGRRTLVVGLGMNLVLGEDARARIDAPIAQLAECRDAARLLQEREAWIVRLAEAMIESVQRFETSGFGAFRDAFDSVFAYRDAPVHVLATSSGAGENIILHRGIARGVDSDGRLLVEVDGKLVHVSSGELRLRARGDSP